MIKLIELGIIEEVKTTNSMLHLVGVAVALYKLGRAPQEFFLDTWEAYVEVRPQAFKVTKMKVEHILGIADYNWWAPQKNEDGKTWRVERSPCQFSNAFEAPDEDTALLHIEVNLELQTKRMQLS